MLELCNGMLAVFEIEIVAGRGKGETNEVVEHKNGVLTLEYAWMIPPNHTSILRFKHCEAYLDYKFVNGNLVRIT